MSSDGGSNHEDQPRREIHFNLATGESNGKVSEANYDSPDEDQDVVQVQTKKVFKVRGESAKITQQSPIRSNNYLIALDNNDNQSKKPPNGFAKRTKDFPISATTFFKSPSRNQLGEKGLKFDSNSKSSKQQKKLGQTYQKANAFGQRSQSAKDINRIKGLQRDPQDVAHSLHVLKIQYNNIVEDNTRLKTRNKNLEAVINTLYDDLNNQQQEIQKIYQGKQIRPAILITGTQIGLKRQLREERLINKNLSEELDSLKKSLKATNAAEQATQIQFYQEECVRLRSMLELEIRQNKQTALTMIEENVNVLTATTDEERKRILSELEKQNEELKFIHKQNTQLRIELDQARLKRHEAQKLKQMGDLQNRQAFLIKTKGQEIRTMEEQIQVLNSKVENYDRLTQRNIELSKQITELNHKLSQRNNELKSLKEVTNLNKSQTMKLPNLQQSPSKKSFSPVPALVHKSIQVLKVIQPPQKLQQNPQPKQKILDLSSQLLQTPAKPFERQMSVPLEQRKNAQQTRPKDDFDKQSSKPSFHMDTSPAQNLSSRPQSDSTQIFKRIVLTKQELCVRGINNFRALAEKKEQPNNDIEMAFYKTYSKDIQQLYRKMQHQTLPLEVIKKLLDNRVTLPQGLNLQETARICSEKFSVSANELQVCEIILNHFIPCIQGEIFYADKFYLRLEVLVNTHSENSMQSQENEGSIQEEELIESDLEKITYQQSHSEQRSQTVNVKMFDSRERPMNVQVLSFLEEQINEDRSKEKQRNPPKKSPRQISEQKLDQFYSEVEIDQRHVVENKSSEYSQSIDESPAGSMSGHSGNMIDQIVNMNNSITEEQMLDTAEQILNTLAQKLIENGWTVHDVFGQPEEIVRIIPEYENQRNIKVLSASNFLGRIYQVGIQNLTQLQVACLMRVLGKPEFDDSVRYDELELLLENFGVTKDQPSVMLDDNQDTQLMEEQKVDDQIALGGSPQNYTNYSGELSEEVVFIDDTKPVVDFPLDKKSQDQVIEERFAKEVPQGTTPSHPQRLFSGLQNNQKTNQAMEMEEQKNIISPGLPIPSTSLKKDRLKSATKNSHSRQNSVYENTPTFVHLSAGQGTSGKNTTKSYQIQGDLQGETDPKEKKFDNQFDTPQIETALKPAVQSTMVNQSYQTSEQKESRQQISKQVLAKSANERLVGFFFEVISKITIQELIVQVEKGGYKQQIKSKTTLTETSVINIDALISILEAFSKTKLRPEELKALQDCTQLTPKFSKIIAVKHLATFLKEVEQLDMANLRSPEKTTAFGRKDRPMVF